MTRKLRANKDNTLRTQAEIAAHFNTKYDLNIDRTTISKIINKKDKWLCVEGGSKTGFKHHQVKFPLIEEAMSIATSKGVILTESLVTEKAELFAKLLEISEDELSFSNGWIFKFKLRIDNDSRAYRLHGEANSAPLETLPIQRQKLQEILSQYDPDNIYNADETGLFFRMAQIKRLQSVDQPEKNLYVILKINSF